MVVLIVLQNVGDAAGIRDTRLSSGFAVGGSCGRCTGVHGAEVGGGSMEEDDSGAILHARYLSLRVF